MKPKTDREQTFTTVRIDQETLSKLRVLAAGNDRSSTAHLRWLIRLEYEKWKKAAALAKGAGRSSREG